LPHHYADEKNAIQDGQDPGTEPEFDG